VSTVRFTIRAAAITQVPSNVPASGFCVGALRITRSELSVCVFAGAVRATVPTDGSTQLVHDSRRVWPLFPGHGDECFQECFC
jgi:hypothetical protein